MTFDSRRGGRTVEGELAVFAMEEGIHVYRAAVRGLLGGGSPPTAGREVGHCLLQEAAWWGGFPPGPLECGWEHSPQVRLGGFIPSCSPECGMRTEQVVKQAWDAGDMEIIDPVHKSTVSKWGKEALSLCTDGDGEFFPGPPHQSLELPVPLGCWRDTPVLWLSRVPGVGNSSCGDSDFAIFCQASEKETAFFSRAPVVF